MTLENLHADGMEGPDQGFGDFGFLSRSFARSFVPEPFPDPLLHLVGGFVGKSDRQNAVG